MGALTRDRNTPEKEARIRAIGVAANVKIFAGSLVVLNVAGFAEPATAAPGKTPLGRAERFTDNTGGANGAVSVRVARGVFAFANSSGADAITTTSIGTLCYMVDDQTIAKTDGGATRSVAGKVFDVDDLGVWVKVG
jgi:hypothetical protein